MQSSRFKKVIVLPSPEYSFIESRWTEGPMSEAKTIRAEVVAAYSHCPRKAFLLHCTEDQGARQEYLAILEERTKVNRTQYLAALYQTNASIRSYGDGAISSVDVLTEANLRAADLEAYCDVLARVSSTRRERSRMLLGCRVSSGGPVGRKRAQSLISTNLFRTTLKTVKGCGSCWRSWRDSEPTPIQS